MLQISSTIVAHLHICIILCHHQHVLLFPNVYVMWYIDRVGCVRERTPLFLARYIWDAPVDFRAPSGGQFRLFFICKTFCLSLCKIIQLFSFRLRDWYISYVALRRNNFICCIQPMIEQLFSINKCVYLYALNWE